MELHIGDCSSIINRYDQQRGKQQRPKRKRIEERSDMPIEQGKKEHTPPPRDPLSSRSVARPRGHRAKTAMVYTIFLGKQGKRVYTIGPKRRVYTIEPQTRKKKKRGVSTVVVYIFFFPVEVPSKRGEFCFESTASKE